MPNTQPYISSVSVHPHHPWLPLSFEPPLHHPLDLPVGRGSPSPDGSPIGSYRRPCNDGESFVRCQFERALVAVEREVDFGSSFERDVGFGFPIVGRRERGSVEVQGWRGRVGTGEVEGGDVGCDVAVGGDESEVVRGGGGGSGGEGELGLDGTVREERSGKEGVGTTDSSAGEDVEGASEEWLKEERKGKRKR